MTRAWQLSEIAPRALAALYAAAAALGLVTLALPRPPELHDRSLLVLSLASAAAAGLVVTRRRVTAGAARMLSFAGVLLAGAAVAASGGVPSAAAMLFVWPVLFSAYVLTRRDLAGHLALSGIVYAGLVLLAPEPLPLVSHWFTTLTTLAVAGLVIERLRCRLEQAADTDPLTGLPNRRALSRELERAVAYARRTTKPLSVAILDLDHFKAYNDAHGHDGGDRLLTSAAAAWQSSLRATDVLARYGGEEFVVVLADCAADEAVALLERLRAVTPSGATCSVGLAQWRPGESVEAALGRADGALYRAKEEGRNRVVRAADLTPAAR